MVGGEACGGRTSSKGGRAGGGPVASASSPFLLHWASAWLTSPEAQHRSEHDHLWSSSSRVPCSAELLGRAPIVSVSSLVCPLTICPGCPSLRLLATQRQ